MLIRVENLTHVYMPGTPMEAVALEGINLEIGAGDFVALIGQTGSGKSTLIQHFNGLLRPTTGRVIVDGLDLSKRETNLKEVRRRVGLVFQYPEHQLFEETVVADISYGPRNLGLRGAELEVRVREAMEMVGLDYGDLKDRSPFELSGGQMRRVAIAGVLAMEPQVLILDEPTAGLDPRGRDEILDQVKELHQRRGLTVVLVSHSMEDVARLADRLVVMHQGRLVLSGMAREVFAQEHFLRALGLDTPQATQLIFRLKERGAELSMDTVLTVDEAYQVLVDYLAQKRGNTHA